MNHNFSKSPHRKLLDGKSVLLASGIALRAFLEVGYVYFIHPLYEYSGFGLKFAPEKYLESWVAYLLILLGAPAVLKRPSDFLITILIVGLIAPAAVLYPYLDKERYYFYLLVASFFIINLTRKGRLFKVKVIEKGPKKIIVFCWFLAVVVSLWYVISGGFQYFNLDLSKVYDFRRDSAEATDVGLMAYVNGWAPKVAGPALLTFYLWKRKYLVAAAVVLLHIFWFGVSAHKSVLFTPLLVLFLWKWFDRTKSLSFVYIGLTLITVGVLIPYFFDEERIVLASLFLRRVYFVVAQLVFSYMEFFSVNEKIFWSNSFLSGFINYPYSAPPPIIIGSEMGSDAYANVSFIGAGYMHAGSVGVVVYAFAVGLIFKMVDSIANKRLPLWVSVSIVLISSWSLLLSTDLPTAILTHGLALALLILLFIRDSHLESS
ncbi:hypothetical protein D3C87_740920 [compost metagenome]